MQNTDARQRLAANPAALERAEKLLLAYPNVSEDEVAELSNYLRSAPQLDIGLLSSNTAAWSASEQLRTDRKDLFRTPLRTWLIFAVLAVGVAILVVLLSDSALHS